jgi:rubrerythrin
LSEWTLEKALDLAIMMEEQSIQLYTSTLGMVTNPGSKILLKELLEMEKTHKESLQEAKNDPEKVNEIGSLDYKIPDLGIAGTASEAKLSPNADYQEILLYAAQREESTHGYYMNLAGRFEGKQIGAMFEAFAKEEMKHKYQLEKEYDDYVLQDM